MQKKCAGSLCNGPSIQNGGCSCDKSQLLGGVIQATFASLNKWYCSFKGSLSAMVHRVHIRHFRDCQPLRLRWTRRLVTLPWPIWSQCYRWNGNTSEQVNGVRRMSSGGQRTVYDNQDPVLRLEAKMALLRREMVALRQTDLSLLCQLWSVNEMLQVSTIY